MVQQIISTPIGQFVADWTSAGLYSFEFDRRENLPTDIVHPRRVALGADAGVDASYGDELLSALRSYFESGELRWDLRWCDWTSVSEFHRRVLHACFEIPCGQTRTYRQLADQVGSPRAARAVGGAMARNRWPLLIPCHRVVGASGKLVGYSGVGGTQTKERLLAMEARWGKGQGLVSVGDLATTAS